MTNLDVTFNLEDEDWAKRTWDLGDQPRRLATMLVGQGDLGTELRHFMTLPSARSMPFPPEAVLYSMGWGKAQVDEWMSTYVAKGEAAGHPFRGNQYVGGRGGGGVPGAETGLLWPLSGQGVKGSIQALVTLDGLPENIATKVVGRMTDTMGVTPDQATANISAIFSQAFEGGHVKEDAAWYQVASDQVMELSKKTGLSPLTAVGVTAALSPGKEWGANVESAATVAHWVTQEKGYTIAAESVDKINAQLAAGKGELATTYRVKTGQTLGDLLKENEYAATIAIAHANKFDVGYGYGNITKAVHIAANGESSIDETLNGAKVRSFFNNIAQPNNPDSITVDTHMIRAMMNGLGSPEGEQRIRNVEAVPAPTPSDPLKTKSLISKVTGSPAYNNAELGAYPAMADAIRNTTTAMNEKYHLSLLPSQVQAVVWMQQIRNYPRPKMKAVLSQIAGEEAS